jgi:hypothetical protein
MTKTTFEELGKFPQVPLMEDFIFVRTAVRKNAHIITVHRPAITSARRWVYVVLTFLEIIASLYKTFPIKQLGSSEFGKQHYSILSSFVVIIWVFHWKH